MTIEIPESGKDALARLLTADANFLDALCDALAKAKPSLFWHDSAINDLAVSLQKFPAGDKQSLRSILRMFSGVLSWRDEELPSQLASDLIDSARSSDDEKLSGKGTDEDWKRLHAFLERVFSLDQLSISARALHLYTQTPRHMHTARVLTDARPIFTKPVDGGPTGFLVVHTLQLEYADESGEEHEFFIAIDGDDLETLKNAAERALQKEKSLTVTLEKTALPIITYPKS